MSESIHILSLGAGLQSSTMGLMAARGEITPMPKCGLFADTQDEPDEVYEYLKYLTALLPFPIIKVTNGRLSDTFGEKFVHIPSFRRKADGSVSMGKKQCTRHFKIKPIYRYIKDTFHPTSKHPVIMWVGISTDEISRVKPARVKYVQNTWPLIDKRMNRDRCVSWIERNGYSMPPKSACQFCPLHSDLVWSQASAKTMKRAIEIDQFLRTTRNEFLHQSCKPLAEVNFSKDNGQINMFNNECSGHCGV